MNCPNCGTEIAQTEAAVCPGCGQALKPPEVAVAQPMASQGRINWFLFFAILLAPPLLTALVAHGGRDAEGAAIGIALLGGGLAGVICGIMLAHRLGSNTPTKVALAVALIAVLSTTCVGMSCFGCMAGGFHMDFR